MVLSPWWIIGLAGTAITNLYVLKKACSSIYKLIFGGIAEKARSAFKLTGMGAGAGTGVTVGFLLGFMAPGVGNIVMIVGASLGALVGFLAAKYTAQIISKISVRMRSAEEQAKVVSSAHPEGYKLKHPCANNDATYQMLKQLRSAKHSLDKTVLTRLIPGLDEEPHLILQAVIEKIISSSHPEAITSQLDSSTPEQTNCLVGVGGKKFLIFKDTTGNFNATEVGSSAPPIQLGYVRG